MSFLIPVFTAIGSGLSAVAGGIGSMFGAGGAAAAGGTAAGAAAGGLSATTILQGATGVISALGKLSAGAAQANALDQQAKTTEIEAEREDNLSIQRQTAMKRNLIAALGENEVNAAAAGIDLSGGLVADVNAAAEADTTRELSIDRLDRDFRKSMLRARAAGYRSQARAARTAGGIGALGSVFQTGLSIAERG